MERQLGQLAHVTSWQRWTIAQPRSGAGSHEKLGVLLTSAVRGRGHRFSVQHLLELLAADWSTDEIRSDLPFVEPEDIQQALAYAAALLRGEEPTTVSDKSPEPG